jgi:tRNA A-37 threonylcarbamoyl transferase component Bud32
LVATQELIGQKLGQYEILELIGEGGMARVYRALQPTLEREVAIKALPTEIDDVRDQDLVRRFDAEAKLVARLSHPHIVPVHDFGENSGWAYIVMEFIPHGTVRERLRKAESMGARIALPWAISVIEQAALALDFAHVHGVVHRDVKPGNMLMRTADYMLLTDFGVATILESSKALSRSGSTAGTPQYMAPEQGRQGGEVDGRTDIYSLGVVLFQCVTGRLPFNAENAVGVIMKHMSEPLPSPLRLVPDLPAQVDYIIRRAMEKEPQRRYQRAADMAADLHALGEEMRLTGRVAVPSIARPPAGSTPVAPGADPVSGGAVCYRCGFGNSPQNRYCTRCGYDLASPVVAADQLIGRSGRPLRARLVFETGPLQGAPILLHQETMTIGRGAGFDLVIHENTISRHGHTRITFSNGAWYVEDLGSTNGTKINGRPITRPVPLSPGDELRMGDVIATFEPLD